MRALIATGLGASGEYPERKRAAGDQDATGESIQGHGAG